ncbi:MAG TPA: T9SS type A sorting domain-containing protein [Elusimicrobiota bacterium]|nr:T9SS type A sorting domain-containing protein [Elusimicrobiota bacterium]
MKRRFSSSYKTFLKALSALLLGMFLLPSAASALDLGIDGLRVDWSPSHTGGTTLTWDSVDPSTTDAIVTYYVLRLAGYHPSTTTVVLNGTTVAVTNVTTYKFGDGGVYTYIVRAFDSLATPSFVDDSPVQYSHLIHYDLSPVSQNITRYDAGNGQDGNGQQWNFEYKLQDDAYVTIAVYPETCTFGKDAAGFYTTPSSGPIKVILDNTPRSNQMVDDSFVNKDFWDLRNSSGAVVGKGLYQVLFTVKSKYDATTVIDTALKTLPVDTIRIADISASALTDASGYSAISFNVNADCEVKVIVCKPGTKFAVATASGTLGYLTASNYAYVVGDNLPLNPTTLVVDGTRLLKVLRYYVDSGNQTFSWNGVDEEGNTLASSIYPYTLSAMDAFNNHAVLVAGDNYSQFGTITINRVATQPRAISLAAVYPAPNETVTSRINSVYAVLDPKRTDVTVDGSISTLYLTGPNNTTVIGQKRWDDAQKRMVYYLTQPLTQDGQYTMNVYARGKTIWGDDVREDYTSSFVLQIPHALQDSYVSPNPLKGASSANFGITLNSAATVRLRIFNLLGEEVYDRTESFAAGPQIIAWNLRNDSGQRVASGVYIYRLEVDGPGGSEEVTKKLVVIQ